MLKMFYCNNYCQCEYGLLIYEGILHRHYESLRIINFRNKGAKVMHSKTFCLILSMLICTFVLFTVSCSKQEDSAKQTSSAKTAAQTADYVFTNGKIYTVNEKQPWAEAVAINDGKFIAVGSNADVKKVMAELGDQADKVTVAMETVDIDRDTDEVITAYVQSFVPDAHGLRAKDDTTLRAAADIFGADYDVLVDDEGKIDVLHTAHLYAVDDEGLLQVTWAFGTPPETIAKDIRLLLRQS